MNRIVFIGILFFFSSGLFAQKILLVENVNSLKNIKYYQGESIKLKFNGFDGKIDDRIYDLTDSTVILNMLGEVRFGEITCIYRENWLVKILRGLSLIGGVAYFGIDSFNRLINNENPVIDSGTAIISGSMVAFSFALVPLRYKKIHTGVKWKLRTINLDAY